MLPRKISDSVTYAKPRSRPTLSSELSPAFDGWPRSSSERVLASQIPAPPCGHVPASGRTPEAGAESMGLRDRADSSSFCPVLGLLKRSVQAWCMVRQRSCIADVFRTAYSPHQLAQAAHRSVPSLSVVTVTLSAPSECDASP